MHRILFVLIIALILFPAPVKAQGCAPEVVWQKGSVAVPFGIEQRGAIVDVVYDPAFYSLIFQGAENSQSWEALITMQDNTGFTIRIVRPVEYKYKQVIYLDYWAVGYVDTCKPGVDALLPAYKIMLPMIVQ